MIGANIAHYRIVEKVGEGGMGVVYKAEDTKLNRTVALKFLSSALIGDEKQKARLIQEARAAAALDHPSICTVYEVGEIAGQTYLAMGFVDGETLADLIHLGNLETGRAIEFAIQIAEGLQEAHDKGVVHRDIKSANIMVTKKGQAKILDFGIAKDASSEETSGTRLVAGTPAYMSPEQTSRERVDQRTDIWSLGVVLYEMLAGQVPFSGEYEAAVVYSVLHEDPPPLGEKAGDLPEGTESIIRKALEKKPQNRYQNAGEMLADLKALRSEMDTKEVAPTPRTTTQEVPLPAGKRWRWPAAVVFSLLAAIAVWNHTSVDTSVDSATATVSTISKPSIAVLPLTDLTAEQEDYFAEGMSEELTTTLAKIGALRVISRTSVARYKDSKVPVRQIAKDLNVSYVVEGSVRRAGDRVRINAQLIDTGTEELLWTRSYERDLRDVLKLQSEVARSIATQIRVKLSPTEELQLSRAKPVDPEAYEQYLRGRFFTRSRTREGLEKALHHYQTVLAADPDSALAHAGMADVYLLQANHGFVPPDEVWPKAKSAAEEAIRLDPNLAEAHSTLGLILSRFEWKWDEAEGSYLKALELYPGDATANHRYAVYLSRIGKHPGAIEFMQRAHELDPLSLTINNALGVIHFMAGQYRDAVEQFKRNLELTETYYRTHYNLGRCYLELSQVEDAIAAFEKARELSNDNPFIIAAVANAYARAGQVEKAKQLQGTVSERAKSQYVSPAAIALVCLGLQDIDQSFHWLEAAYRERAAMLTWLKVDPVFDPVRPDPRFDDLLSRVGFSGE